MKVTIKAFATIREALGRGWMQMEIENEATVGQLLLRLSEVYGERFSSRVLNPDKKTLTRGLKILVNGRDIDFLQGLETKLKDGDVVTLIPPVAGG